MEITQKIKELIFNGLCTDGAHHKQWYLEQIAEHLGYDPTSEEDYEEYLPEPGIAP